MSVFINSLLQNTNLVSVLSKNLTKFCWSYLTGLTIFVNSGTNLDIPISTCRYCCSKFYQIWISINQNSNIYYSSRNWNSNLFQDSGSYWIPICTLTYISWHGMRTKQTRWVCISTSWHNSVSHHIIWQGF